MHFFRHEKMLPLVGFEPGTSQLLDLEVQGSNPGQGKNFFMSLKLIFFPSVGRVEIEALDAVDDF